MILEVTFRIFDLLLYKISFFKLAKIYYFVFRNMGQNQTDHSIITGYIFSKVTL